MRLLSPLLSTGPKLRSCTGVYAGQMVVRDRIELSTFRFSEGLSPTREPLADAAPQPVYQQIGLSGACGSSLAGVPTCAGLCRFVRVICVLDPSRSRTCVAAVLAAAAGQPSRLCPRTWRACPRPEDRPPSSATWSAACPAIPAARLVMTVACQQHGTTLRDFLPRAWDHPVASYGTTRRVVPGLLITGRYGCLQVDRLGGSGDGVPGGRGD